MTDPDPTSTPVPTRTSRRDAPREDRLEILRRLESGGVTVDEAQTLLDALDRAERPAPAAAEETPARAAAGARQVRIRITDGSTRRAAVNLVLPLDPIDTGLKLGRRFAPARLPPADAIREAIAGGFRGSPLAADDGRERDEIAVA